MPTTTCAFLTTDDLEGFVTDDELVLAPLRERGVEVTLLPWRAGVDWRRFEAVVIRTTWDYQAAPGEFLEVLEAIEGSGARLANDLDLVRWNLSKTYLRDLRARGATIVPTRFGVSLCVDELRSRFDELGAGELVVKPVIGANAGDAYRLTRERLDLRAQELKAVFRDRGFLVQPFIPSVVDEGEFSLVFFGGRYSHTILKTPKPGDFRVQEEHGAAVRPVKADGELLAAARRCLAALDRTPLQARVDLVRLADGDFAVMELELIEPALYFRMDAKAPARFAAAFEAWLGGCLPPA
jgi:glutathione synthase/RimK-type ligase-like ATP-grasp enzyme